MKRALNYRELKKEIVKQCKINGFRIKRGHMDVIVQEIFDLKKEKKNLGLNITNEYAIARFIYMKLKPELEGKKRLENMIAVFRARIKMCRLVEDDRCSQ